MQHAALLVVLALLPGHAVAQGVPEPEGYREAPYRAPVPAGLTGASTVTTEEAHRLWQDGNVAFVDVLPRDARPADLPEGTIWREGPRDTIPGATWLPNVGYAELSSEEAAYFRKGLQAVSDGDPMDPVLFFCRDECWMSWNAAKRALAHGHAAVIWYPQGTDGWTRAGHPTERAVPMDPS